MYNTIRSYLSCVMMACMLLLAGPEYALSATVWWTGTDWENNLNWSNASNWDAGVPTAADTAYFGNAYRCNVDVNFKIKALIRDGAQGGLRFGSTTDTILGVCSLGGAMSDTTYFETSTLHFYGDAYRGPNQKVVVGTSTHVLHVADKDSLLRWLCYDLQIDADDKKITSLNDTTRVYGDLDQNDGNLRFRINSRTYVTGDALLDGDSILASATNVEAGIVGAGGTWHIGAGGNCATLGLKMDGNLGVIDDDKGVTMKSLTIGASDTVTNSGGATTTYSGLVPITFVNGGKLTNSRTVAFNFTGSSSFPNATTGIPVFAGSAGPTLRPAANSVTLTLSPVSWTNSGAVTITNVGAVTGVNINLGADLNMSSASLVSCYCASTAANFTLNTLGYDWSVGSIDFGNAGATSTFNYNFNTGTVMAANRTINPTAGLNIGTIVSRDSATWTHHNFTAQSNADATYYVGPACVHTVDSVATLTSNAKKWAKKIVVNAPTYTVSSADAINTDSLVVTAGTITFAGAGNDTIGYASITGTANFAGDTTVFTGDVTTAAASTITIDAASKWVCTKDGVTLVVDGKSIPLVQLIGTGRINGGATIAQLLPASDDSVIIQAATRVNITSVPATTWDGTAGHLKYFLTPTINQGCTLSTPAYTASHGYYGGIFRDSIDAAFGRGNKSRGDNGGF